MQLLWCMRERTNFDRGVLSLFLCLRKNYSEMKRNGQGQIKTCRRKQHVKTDGMKGISNLFCGIFAVGGNYNLTRDTYAAMRRSTNGGGENSPLLQGEDDLYEMFLIELM